MRRLGDGTKAAVRSNVILHACIISQQPGDKPGDRASGELADGVGSGCEIGLIRVRRLIGRSCCIWWSGLIRWSRRVRRNGWIGGTRGVWRYGLIRVHTLIGRNATHCLLVGELLRNFRMRVEKVLK